MKSFWDKFGREWLIDLSIGDVDPVRDICGIDLYRILDDKAKPLQSLFSDLPLFGKVLYVVLADQAEKHQVDAAGFTKGLTGPVLLSARVAFREALIDFFQSQPATATAIREILAALEEFQAATMEQAKARIATLKNDAIERAKAMIDELPLSELSGKPLEGSA